MPGRYDAIVAVGAIGVGRLVDIRAPGPTDVATRLSGGVARDAVLPAGGDVAGIRGGAERAGRPLPRERAVVARVAAQRRNDHRVNHRVIWNREGRIGADLLRTRP